MTYTEVLEQAKRELGKSACKACPVCDGKACGNKIPGPGAKGSGTVAIKNYEAWQRIELKMDTIYESSPVDTRTSFFGVDLVLPVMAGPVGAIDNHYGNKLNDKAYNKILLEQCRQAGILGFTGDGIDASIMRSAAAVIAACRGCGVPTIKPWDMETIFKKIDEIRGCNCPAVAMDVDAAGLPFLNVPGSTAGPKSVAQLKAIVKNIKKPFIVKGIMTPEGALKAKKAGAAAIVVSNHGGRVLDGTPATADVLPEIRRAVGSGMKILVDGGIRSGMDVFKAIALGADYCLICRPFVTMVYGSELEGVGIYVEKLQKELADAMKMTGAATLRDITMNKLYFKGK